MSAALNNKATTTSPGSNISSSAKPPIANINTIQSPSTDASPLDSPASLNSPATSHVLIKRSPSPSESLIKSSQKLQTSFKLSPSFNSSPQFDLSSRKQSNKQQQNLSQQSQSQAPLPSICLVPPEGFPHVPHRRSSSASLYEFSLSSTNTPAFNNTSKSPLSNNNASSHGNIPPSSSYPSFSNQNSNTESASSPSVINVSQYCEAASSPSAVPQSYPTFDINEIRSKIISQWTLMADQDNLRIQIINKTPRARSPCFENDVVSQGLITKQEAARRLVIYRTKFYKYYPLVAVDEKESVDDVRRKHPVLFLTIMSIVSPLVESKSRFENSENNTSPQSNNTFTDYDLAVILNHHAIDTIVYEIMILGRKTLELLRCLLLVNLWYNTPEMFHQQKAHLITHMAITMAIDLGLSGGYSNSCSPPPNPSSAGVNRTREHIKYDRLIRPHVLQDPLTNECRKLWLCVYICSINVSTVIKKPVYMMWSKYTEECCEILEKSPHSDERRVATIARLNHTLEQLTYSLQSADTRYPPDINDPRTQSLFRYFEMQIKDQTQMDVFNQSKLFATSFYAIQSVLHESVMYSALNERFGRTPFSEYSLAVGDPKLTSSVAAVNALGWCYSSAINLVSIFLNLSHDEMACMPLSSYSRMVFGVSILLKLRTLYYTVPRMKDILPNDYFNQFNTMTGSYAGPNKNSNTNNEGSQEKYSWTIEHWKDNIETLLNRLDKVREMYPFANCALTFSSVLRILILHFEKQLESYIEEEQLQQQSSNTTKKNSSLNPNCFVSPSFGRKTSLSAVPEADEKQSNINNNSYDYMARRASLSLGALASGSFNGNAITTDSNYANNNPSNNPQMERRYSEIVPGSPLDILSNLATETSLQKRTETERDVIMFMQSQQYQNSSSNTNNNNAQPSPLTTTTSSASSINSSSATTPPIQTTSNHPNTKNSFNYDNNNNNKSFVPPSPPPPAPLSSQQKQQQFNQNLQQQMLPNGTSSIGIVNSGGPGDYMAMSSWLFTEDSSWKDLVFGAEALTGFDMF